MQNPRCFLRSGGIFLHLDDLQIIHGAERGDDGIGMVEVVVGHRGDVVLQRQVAAAGAPAQRLNGDADILLEVDGIGKVPAVEPKARLRAVDAVGADHLRQAGIGRGKGLVLVRGLILEVVGAAEVVLRARAADGGILAVVVEEELDLPSPHQPVLFTPQHM